MDFISPGMMEACQALRGSEIRIFRNSRQMTDRCELSLALEGLFIARKRCKSGGCE